MPVQPVQHRYLWTTAIPLFLVASGAMWVTSGNVDGPAIWFFSFFVLGMPHGALDVARLWRVLPADSARLSRMSVLLVMYMCAALGMVGLWFLMPPLALFCFLGLTVWHWGTAETQCSAPAAEPQRLFGLMRGLWVLCLPIACDFPESVQVLEGMLQLLRSDYVIVRDLALLSGCIGGIAFVSDLLQQVRLRRWWKVTEVCLLGTLAVTLPALAFIGLFFVFIHSWRYLLATLGRVEAGCFPGKVGTRYWTSRLENTHGVATAQDRPRLRALREYAVATLVSLALLLAWIMGFPPSIAFWEAPLMATSAYLLVISILTVPHAILIEVLDGDMFRRDNHAAVNASRSVAVHHERGSARI